MLTIAGQLFLKFHGQRQALQLVEKKSQSLIVELCNKELFDVKRKSRKDKRGCLKY